MELKYIQSTFFFFFNWLWAVKCEGVSAWVKDKELSGHSPPNQPWTPGECHDLTGTVGPACLASRPGAWGEWLETFSGGMGLLRESPLFREGPLLHKGLGPFARSVYEFLRNHSHFCSLTLVHKQDAKYSNSSDRANCANSWWANWGPLSVITVARITCQRDLVFQPSVIAAAL